MARVWPMTVAAVLVLLFVVLSLVARSGAQVPQQRVSAFPMPGIDVARPETQISFRGAPAAALGPITVTGSQSGPHPGDLREHSDGDGPASCRRRPSPPASR